MSRFIMPRQGVKGQNLSPHDGAKLYFKVIGQLIGGTDKTVYTDEALSVASANPVIADSTGLFGELWQDGDYDVYLRDKNGVLKWGPETVRNIAELSADALSANELTTVTMTANTVRAYSDGGTVITKEFSTGNGGGGTYDVVLTASVTPNTFDIIIGVADASISFVLRIKSEMEFRAFGTVGDGATDDKGAAQAACDSKARKLLGHPDDVYLFQSQVTMAVNQTIDWCGGEYNCDESGLVRYLVTSSGCTVENGTARSTTTDVTVRGAEYQQPICIGVSNSLTDFVENVIVRKMTISSTSPEGNALFVFGACNNILCEDIIIDAGAALGEPIGGHWSVEPGGDETQGTGHPNNVVYRNIKIGAQTYGGAGAIFLSAVRNFTFENIEVEGFTGDSIFQVFAGDHGYKYANDNFSVDMGAVISMTNMQGIGKKGVIIQLKDTLEDLIVWESTITLDNVNMQSNDTTVTTSRGLDIGSVKNVTVKNSSFDLFYNGLFLNSTATGMTIEDTRFTNSYKNGVDADNSVGCENLTFSRVKFKDSNTATGTGYDMIFGSFIDGITIEGCKFDSPLVTNTLFTVVAAPPRNMRVINNHVEQAGGANFVLGGSSSFGICELFNGNTQGETNNNNIRAGQDYVPYSLTGSQNSGTPIREFMGPIAADPAFGTYHQNDRIYSDAVTTASKIGKACTVGGSQSTYSEGVTATTDGTTTVVLSAESTVLRRNDYVTINATDVRILSITGTTMITSATVPAGAGLAIAFDVGTFVTWGATD